MDVETFYFSLSLWWEALAWTTLWMIKARNIEASRVHSQFTHWMSMIYIKKKKQFNCLFFSHCIISGHQTLYLKKYQLIYIYRLRQWLIDSLLLHFTSLKLVLKFLKLLFDSVIRMPTKQYFFFVFFLNNNIRIFQVSSVIKKNRFYFQSVSRHLKRLAFMEVIQVFDLYSPTEFTFFHCMIGLFSTGFILYHLCIDIVLFPLTLEVKESVRYPITDFNLYGRTSSAYCAFIIKWVNALFYLFFFFQLFRSIRNISSDTN